MRNNKHKLLRIILSLSLCFCTVLGSASSAFAGLADLFKDNENNNTFNIKNNDFQQEIVLQDPVIKKDNGMQEFINSLSAESSGNSLSEANYLNAASFYGYVLVVSSGVSGCSDVSKIVVKYKDEKGGINSQLIDPAEKSSVLGLPSSFADIINSSGWLQSSRISSYGPLYNRASGNTRVGIESFYGKNNNYFKHYDLVESWAKALTHSDSALAKYIPSKQITNPSSNYIFKAFTTEYIVFFTKNRIASVEELDFVLSGEKECDWTLDGWKLFNVDFAQDSKHYTGPTLNTYSYFSDRIAMNFNGTLVSQSSAKELAAISGVQMTKGISNIRFATPEKIGPLDLPIDNVGSGSFTVGSSYKSNRQILNFKINISKELGSGLDSFVSYLPNCGIVVRDVLYAQISYENDMGFEEEVTVPVISESLLEAAMTADEKDLLNSTTFKSICGWDTITQYACDGTSILFSVDFPNFKKLNRIRLKYTNDVDPRDNLNIDSIQVYDDNSYGQRGGYYVNNNSYVDSNGNLKYDNTMVAMGLPSGVNLMYTTDSANLSSGSSPELIFIESNKVDVPATEYANKYLITIKTDNAKDVGTLDTVYTKFTYTDIYGNSKETEEMSLVDLCNDFYGENKGIIGTLGESYTAADEATVKELKTEHSWITASLMTIVKPTESSYKKIQCYGVDITYATHMAQGSSMSFIVEIPELKEFTGARFRIDGEDMWQLGYLSISKLQNLGTKRRVNVGQKKIAGINYLYDIERSASGLMMYENTDVGLLIKDGYKELELTSFLVSSDEETVRDYTEYYYTMTKSQVMSNLHMSNIALTYEVTAKVASNRSKGTVDDGTGSNNLFYFQLQFEKGSSGFVLANSQLASDGFRSGESEVFYISINEDLGDVTGIVILPDTISEESDQMDKLCLDSITVVRRSGTVNKCYNFNNINWIDLNYVDGASNEKKNGRSVSEIATIKKVSSVSYISSFEFALTYGAYKAEESDDETAKEPVYKQFAGDVTANIVYLNQNSERKVIKNYNVVNAMYSYDERQPQYDDATGSGRLYMSDPEWMFRGETTDRFIVSISDASVIQSITLNFNAADGYDGTVNLRAISIGMINSNGVAKINNNGEYQVVYAKELTPVASDVTMTLPCPIDTAVDVTKTQTFVFKDPGTIPSHEDEESGKTLITRVPESANDSINLFVYLDKSAKSPSKGGYELGTTVGYYSAVAGKNLGTKIVRYTESTEDGLTVLSSVGIGTPNFTSLKSLRIKAPTEQESVVIDHAIIQHVRSGVVIETYYCSMFPKNAASSQGASLASGNASSIKYRQQLTLVLDADSPSITLSKEKRDIAACLVYKSNLGGVAREYESENVFISDSGTLKLGGGTVINLDFNEDNVSEIVGVKLQAENGAECLIENGLVRSYRTDENGEESMIGYYSFNTKGSTHVDSIGASVNVSSSEIDPLNELRAAHFSFVTMGKNDVYTDGSSSSYAIDSNGAYPIRMTIGYVNERGQLKTKVIEDIRKLCGGSSNFTQGETAEFTTLIPGITRISYVQFEPKNNSAAAGAQTRVVAAWNLKELSYSIDGTDYKETMTIPIHSQIKECVNNGETPKKYNLSNISVSVSVEHDGQLGYASNGTVTMSGKGGQYATINVDVFGTLTEYGYTSKIEQSFGGGTTVIKPDLKESSNKLTIKLPENTTQFEMQYIVTISSEESPSINSVIKFFIPVAEVSNSVSKEAANQTQSE